MHGLPLDRRRRQEQSRAGTQRPRRPQVRHGRGLQLFRRQQEFRHHLERGPVQGIHQGPEGQGSRHQDVFAGIKNERDQRSLGVRLAIRQGRQDQVTASGAQPRYTAMAAMAVPRNHAPSGITAVDAGSSSDLLRPPGFAPAGNGAIAAAAAGRQNSARPFQRAGVEQVTLLPRSHYLNADRRALIHHLLAAIVRDRPRICCG